MRASSRTAAAVAAVLTLAAGSAACSNGSLDEPSLIAVPATSSADASADTAADDNGKGEAGGTSAPAKAKADCSDEAFSRSFDEDPAFGWYHESCEGDFVVVGPSGSDSHSLAQWDGSKWNTVKPDGVVNPHNGMAFSCFNESTVNKLGIGPKVKAQLHSCETQKFFGEGSDSKKKESADDSGYSYDRVKNSDGYIVDVGLGEAGKKASFPACDGRYILIVDSVIAKGDDGTTFNDLARAVLTEGPSGKEFTVPGQCDSLRKSVHGNDIYPVYLDFGSDKAAACRAKSAYGGNVRPLISGNFPDASNSDVDEARLALDPC